MGIEKYLIKNVGQHSIMHDDYFIDCHAIIHDSMTKKDKSGGKLLEQKYYDDNWITIYLMETKKKEYFVYAIASPPDCKEDLNYIVKINNQEQARKLYNETITFIDEHIEDDEFPFNKIDSGLDY